MINIFKILYHKIYLWWIQYYFIPKTIDKVAKTIRLPLADDKVYILYDDYISNLGYDKKSTHIINKAKRTPQSHEYFNRVLDERLLFNSLKRKI